MSKITDTIREFAGDNKEMLIEIGFDAVVKLLALVIPKAADEAKELLAVAAGVVQVLREKGVPQEAFEKLHVTQDDAVTHILALAKANDTPPAS